MTTEEEISKLSETLYGMSSLSGMGSKLAEEAGEVCGELNRLAEGKGNYAALIDEIGDVTFVLSKIAFFAGVTLEECAQEAIRKNEQKLPR